MIPQKLWNKDILYQSEKLIEIYKNKLIELSMYEHAKNHTEQGSGATGGKDIEETKKHFAERFLTSSARVQFITINPRGEFSYVSRDLQSTFGSGRISILDIPCGTGAGILSLLCNIAELRMESKLPSLPLYINIMGGDYAESALTIYSELLTEIKDYLAIQLIYIEYEVFTWDASTSPSTNLLLRNWLKNEEQYEEFYVLMSAFSGVGTKNYKSFEDSFSFIQTYISHLPSTTIFIEPTTRQSKDFLTFISKMMEKAVDWLIGKEESTNDNRFQWHDPIRNNTAKSGVSIKLYNRGRL